MHIHSRSVLTTSLLALALVALTTPASPATGPSSSQSPYLVPVAAGVETVSILTVGDAVKKRHKGNEPYRMVGIPDGLGAFDNGDGTFTVLMNHELPETSGVVRDHGGRGAFVSDWQVRKSDLKVLKGGDLVQRVLLWNGGEYVESASESFNRFCSADLAPVSALYDEATGLGFGDGLIFLTGEEAGPTGRAFAHIARGRDHGTSYELPRLGRFSWENAVPSPFAQEKTIVAGLDDTAGGELYFYVGTKQAEGSPVDQAGLQNGILYTTAIAGFASEPPLGFTSARFSLAVVENPQAATADPDGTGLNRPEDGGWDPTNPSVFYFVTTATFTGNTRLWQVTFDDIANPEAGGTIEVVLDGAATGVRMMDNMTVDGGGSVYVQEDVGNNPHIGRILRIDPASGGLAVIAEHDRARFLVGTPGFLTQDEEASGIIEVTGLFEGVDGYDTSSNRYFLTDVQAHYPLPGELVQGGQLLLMKVPR